MVRECHLAARISACLRPCYLSNTGCSSAIYVKSTWRLCRGVMPRYSIRLTRLSYRPPCLHGKRWDQPGFLFRPHLRLGVSLYPLRLLHKYPRHGMTQCYPIQTPACPFLGRGFASTYQYIFCVDDWSESPWPKWRRHRWILRRGYPHWCFAANTSFQFSTPLRKHRRHASMGWTNTHIVGSLP